LDFILYIIYIYYEYISYLVFRKHFNETRTNSLVKFKNCQIFSVHEFTLFLKIYLLIIHSLYSTMWIDEMTVISRLHLTIFFRGDIYLYTVARSQLRKSTLLARLYEAVPTNHTRTCWITVDKTFTSYSSIDFV